MLTIKLISMNYKNVLRFNVPFLLLCVFLSCGQYQKVKKEDVIKSFFEDVFVSDKPLDEISELYRDQIDKEESGEMFINHIRFLKSEKEHLTKEVKNIKVESYRTSTLDDLWLFEKKEQKNIYVVSLNDKIESYVLLNKAKIVSFVYFRKGSDNPAYFIPYYQKLGK